MPTKKLQTILVVDDDNFIRDAIKAVVTGAGYRYLEASDGLAALELIKNSTVDLVLLDITIPGVDGLNVCRKIRQDQNPVPVIILTSLGNADTVDAAFDAGATDFLAKPIVFPQVLQRIKFALQNRQIQINLRDKQRQLLHAQKTARLSYWQYDPQKKLVTLSDEIFEYLEKKTIPKMSLAEFISLFDPEDRQTMENQIKTTLTYGYPEIADIHYVTPALQNKVFRQTTEWLTDNFSKGMVFGTLQDITRETNAENLIYFHKHFDQQTGLPNFNQLANQMRKVQTRLLNNTIRSAVLYLGINGLRSLNLTRGQNAVDQIFKTVADRLISLKQENIQVFRHHGNAFVIFINHEKYDGEIDDVAHQACRLVNSEPFVIESEFLQVTASVGISLLSSEVAEPEAILRQAVAAMATVKKHEGGSVSYYDDAIGAHYARRLMIEKELKHAIDNELLQVFYQPQLDCSSGQVKGAEALVRWTTSSGEEIHPEEFIAIAEETNLIIPLGRLVIEKVCQQLRSLHNSGLSDIRLSINLSAKQLYHDDLTDFLVRITDRYGIDRTSIDLEVTESLIMDNYDVCIATLNKLNKLGFSISIDDFGMGYSSLNRLSEMPVSTLKIDKSFVGNIASCEKSANIATAIVALANSLHLNTIAEGVEDVEQLDELKKINVGEAQGWYFSKALNASDFRNFVSQKNAV